MLDRRTAPPYRRITDIYLPPPVTQYLSNGIPLHVIKAGQLDVVKLEFIFKAGSWYEPKKGVSYFATHMLREGTVSKDSKLISDFIDRYGAFLHLSAELDFATVSLYTLSKHLYALVPLMSDIINNAVFPEEELKTLKNIKIQSIKVNDEKNSVVASKKFREALFGPVYPYGRSLETEDVAKIKKDDLRKFYTEWFGNNFEVIVSGKVEDSHIKLVNEYFGHDPLIDEPQPNEPGSYSSGDRTINIQKANSLQSSIRMGKVLFKKTHPDYIKMRVVNEILGGYFGSRLMKNIREEKGYTYGIFSRIVNLKHGGYFIIGADVKKEFASDTVIETYKEIEKLKNEPVGEDELQTVKNYMTGKFLSGINTPFDLADKFKSVYLLGLNYDFYKDYVKTINEIDAITVMEVANQYFKEGSFTEVLVG